MFNNLLSRNFNLFDNIVKQLYAFVSSVNLYVAIIVVLLEQNPYNKECPNSCPFKTSCSYSKITVISWCPDQDIFETATQIFFELFQNNYQLDHEAVPPPPTHRRGCFLRHPRTDEGVQPPPQPTETPPPTRRKDPWS